MQSIERYGVVALLFLVVTVVAVLLWGDGATKDSHGRTLAGRADGSLAAGSGREGAVISSVTSSQRTRPLTDAGSRARGPVAAPPAADRYADRRDRGAGLRTPVGARDEAQPVLEAPSDAGPGRLDLAAAGESGAEPEHRADTARVPAPEPEHPVAGSRVPEPAKGGVPVYVVQKGETLSEIAMHELGTFHRQGEIVALNPGLDPNRIRAGMKLRMPADAHAATGADLADARVAKAAAKEQPKAAEAPAGTRSYRVQPNESLWKIAQRELGSGARWKEIAALNPTLDPDKLVSGKTILVPAGAPERKTAAVAEVASARPADATPRRRVR